MVLMPFGWFAGVADAVRRLVGKKYIWKLED